MGLSGLQGAAAGHHHPLPPGPEPPGCPAHWCVLWHLVKLAAGGHSVIMLKHSTMRDTCCVLASQSSSSKTDACLMHSLARSVGNVLAHYRNVASHSPTAAGSVISETASRLNSPHSGGADQDRRSERTCRRWQVAVLPAAAPSAAAKHAAGHGTALWQAGPKAEGCPWHLSVLHFNTIQA